MIPRRPFQTSELRALEPSPHRAISLQTLEIHMARHITRARLARCVTGAFSALVVCTTAAFLVAHHLARF